MAMTPAGQRNKQIAIERLTAIEDDLGGGEGGTWAVLVEPQAKVLYGSGAERRAGAAEQAVQTATFRVLATTETRAVTVRDRIQFDGIAWDVTGIAPIGGPVPYEIEFTGTSSRD